MPSIAQALVDRQPPVDQLRDRNLFHHVCETDGPFDIYFPYSGLRNRFILFKKCSHIVSIIDLIIDIVPNYENDRPMALFTALLPYFLILKG